MSTPEVAAALERLRSVLQRRPSAGIDADTPALSRWDGGLRAVARHADGSEWVTDMPPELGGQGGASPGWLLRAALASCAVTRIAMGAATEGIALSVLEARASSRSDAGGLVGLADAQGRAVAAGPFDVQLQVRIAAAGESPERLRALVERCARQSPVTQALETQTPVALQVEIGAAA
jgi:uncharacterized OsmC-like protein